MTGLPEVSLRRQTTILLGCILVCFVPGLFGAQFQPGSWYADLPKSALTPPGWVFPIAWSLLYLMMGIALYIFLLHAPERGRRGPLVLFAIQLILNGAWSWIFFGEHAVGLALVEIIVLWLAIAATSFAFARHSPVAGKLLLPYLAWVGFATYLNFAIWRAT